MERVAKFSDDRVYRYLLLRRWAPGFTVTFVCLNPSKADEESDDTTVSKCVGFSKLLGAGALRIVNFFALVSTDPKGLLAARDPVGPRNRHYVSEAVFDSELVIAAWGNCPREVRPLFAQQFRALAPVLQYKDLLCYGTTKDGAPRHPSRIGYKTELEYWPLPQ